MNRDRRAPARILAPAALAAAALALLVLPQCSPAPTDHRAISARRFPENPIIRPKMPDLDGKNINGPSLVRMPDWAPSRLGKYYLYFARHLGTHIRLATADDLGGPWTIYPGGVLQLADTACSGHIASPDVHIDEERREILMYFHGPYPDRYSQRTFLATSKDGLHFIAQTRSLGPSYFRVFRHREWVYALGMPGLFFRSRDGISGFEIGPVLFDQNQRHTAVLVAGDTLSVFYSQAGDCPEHILCATINLADEWMEWQASKPVSVILPATEYEGADLPLLPSERGAIHSRAHQLRDPAIFQENGRIYLLYSVAGENGIAIAELQR